MRNRKRLPSLELEFVGSAEDDFGKALRKHMRLHKGVTLYDLLKFLYQSSMGPFHLSEMMDDAEILNWIRKNLEKTQPSDGLLAEDLLGEKWVRLNFGPYKKKYGNDYRGIYKIYNEAKNMKRGNLEKFKELLAELMVTGRKGEIRSVSPEPRLMDLAENFLKEYEEEEYPPVHHSEGYMSKNSSDYLVVPRSSLTLLTRVNRIEGDTVSSTDLALQETMRQAVDFHGHLGPFLVLGVRAGLLANLSLGKDCFKTRAVVTTRRSPPYSCFVDGIQVATGCTMGKCNVKLRAGKPASILFTKENRRLRIDVKKETLKIIERIKSEREAEKEATRLQSTPISEIFEVAAD